MATRKPHLLLIDDDPNTLASLARAFRLAGYEATVCDNATRGLEMIRAEQFDVIFSDVVMPGKDGISLLEDLKAAGVTTPVVMISGQASVEIAVRATKLGAVDFLEKPLSTEKLVVTTENVLRMRHLEEENRDLRRRLGKHEIIWAGPVMERLMAQIERVAASESRVAIQGETGTGKELVARAIHQKSARRNGPFITLNCAAVPAELIESELFGHEKGSFTGATGRHIGKFEQAAGGTLFLDEIGDMPLPMQAKLLRVLEEGEIERVGGDKPIPVDARVVIATHRNLEELVRQGTFRPDLFHRIYVFPLALPPLRERADEIPALAAYFTGQIAAQNAWKERKFSPEALEILKQYAWPGNVRELRNVVERVLLLSISEIITAEDVNLALPSSRNAEPAAPSAGNGTLAQRMEVFERDVLLSELRRQHHHMTNAARALGLERSHLYKKCQQLGIDLRAERKSD
jgi:two-component system, NtrC family, nitrogen regulation response regulator NtrX